MAAVTAVLHVQWSEVWDLPLWLWREYVIQTEQILSKMREGSNG